MSSAMRKYVRRMKPATRALGEVPYQILKRVRGVTTRTRSSMRTQPLGLSFELPVAPRSV
eukprot:6885375-Pyramimonas_sp.AAC.1